ncbi:hypothetical protein GCM10010401_06970 [Rarobacter faecitabidus]|uniref:Uncharacterized protein n=1 Tax=Rarobacter faecitabidus TaxID=13243 RepID=A0A542ZT78_RARFA|nr:hypothetical protein [Rarobacter faecitabidus]TQL63555.1 hypothetical protein FB461_0015 [Rarobacter faecitabidus]
MNHAGPLHPDDDGAAWPLPRTARKVEVVLNYAWKHGKARRANLGGFSKNMAAGIRIIEERFGSCPS